MSSHANGMDEHNAITSPQMKHSMETGSHNGHDETAEHVVSKAGKTLNKGSTFSLLLLFFFLGGERKLKLVSGQVMFT